jgi:hypothetical protein
MEFSIEYVQHSHKHVADLVVPEPADPQTHQAHLELQQHVDQLRADPDLIKTWHTMIDPLDSRPAPCNYDLFTRRSALTNAAMVLIAYAQGYDGKRDVRDFYKERGLFDVKGTIKDVLPGVGEVVKPHLPNALITEFKQIQESGVDRKSLTQVNYAAELCLDNSQLPSYTFLNYDFRTRLAEYCHGEPTTAGAYFRKAAYEGFVAVVESVAKLEVPSVDELLLQLNAAEHILSMQQMDWRITKYWNRLGYPDMFEDGHYKVMESTDLISILLENPLSLINTGNSTIDALSRKPWLIDQAMTQDIKVSINRIFDILSDQNGLASMLSRASFRGQVHEAIWLIDAVMVSSVFDTEELLFSKAITREDRNFMLNKPAVKRTFDIQVFELGRVFKKMLQLKSSELSASRGQYDDNISVVIEKNFNDTHPRRLAKKRNAYRSILSGEITKEQARTTLGSLALPSVAQTIASVYATK